MASISTCLTITPNKNNTNKPYLKPSLIFSGKPSRQFYNPLCLATHNNNAIFHKQFLKLGKQNNNNRRSYVTQIRAGRFDWPWKETLSPVRIIESDKLAVDVRKLVMDAVDACGRRVTVGDVSSMAGIKLHDAQKALQALTADTDGFLEVSDEGDVLYVFPEDYRSKLASKSLRIKGEQYLNKGKSAAEFLAKVKFGATFIASVVIVMTAIIVIILVPVETVTVLITVIAMMMTI